MDPPVVKGRHPSTLQPTGELPRYPSRIVTRSPARGRMPPPGHGDVACGRAVQPVDPARRKIPLPQPLYSKLLETCEPTTGIRPTPRARRASSEGNQRAEGAAFREQDAAALPAGIHGFKLLGVLGRRPGRTTYLAWQHGLDRRAVVRVWEHEPRYRAILLTDAAFFSACCVPVLAHGVLQDGRTYVATEFMPGKNMQERAQRGAPPPRDVVILASMLCDLLSRAHSHRVFHGALHPRKLWFFGDGAMSARLTGFGQWPLLRRDSDYPVMLAPETALYGQVNAQSDVYGWGLMLHFLLANHLPFQGRDRAQMLAKQCRKGQDVPLHGPPEWCDLVRQCLDPNPDRRPRGMAAVRRALDYLPSAWPHSPRLLRTGR